jgi:hypothetical protein
MVAQVNFEDAMICDVVSVRSGHLHDKRSWIWDRESRIGNQGTRIFIRIQVTILFAKGKKLDSKANYCNKRRTMLSPAPGWI